MRDRMLVLRADDPISFVADSCAAVADAVNEIRPWRGSDAELIVVYALLVRAYADLRTPALQSDPDQSVRVRIVEHLMERLRQAQEGEITMSVIDIVDRLHAELTFDTALT